jgi:ATP-dependent Lon protease
MLFGAYLIGAKEIILTDPYIRLPYQLRNFMEFAKLVSTKKDELEEVKLHLVTNNNEEYIENSKDAFKEMADSLESLGIIFSYEFIENTHDRSLVLDNGWKVVLGRGLDIFQKTNGWYDIAEYYQEKRLCKACEVTYINSK